MANHVDPDQKLRSVHLIGSTLFAQVCRSGDRKESHRKKKSRKKKSQEKKKTRAPPSGALYARDK